MQGGSETITHQLRVSHSAKEEQGGLHWLCTNSLREDTLHKQWLPGDLKGNSLQEGSFFQGQQTFLSHKATHTTEASCWQRALCTLWREEKRDAKEQQLEAVPKGMHNSLTPGDQLYVDAHGGDRVILEDSYHFSPTLRQFQPCSWSNAHSVSLLPWQRRCFTPWLYTLS